MEILTPHNLLPYVLQVVSLAAIATGIAALVRVDSAAIRYAYWRTVLASSLLLPWLPHGTAPAVAIDSAPQRVAVATAKASAAAPLPVSNASMDWMPILLGVLAIGIVVRLVWLAGGLISLRRLRALAATTDEGLGAESEVLQGALGTRADVRVVPGLTQPATFGLRQPVVLLPERIREQPLAIQRALLAHELIHVHRRDWMWVVCEELLLAALWFNPATWWIVAQVRRAREEAVDELAILATGSRRNYVKALLAFAGGTALAPAPAFAERRHLFRRITLISTEAVMSSKRIVLSCLVMAIVLVTGGWYATAAFPLVADVNIQQNQAPGPLEQRASHASLQNPVPRRTDYQPPEYPADARTVGATGTITFRITLDEVGRVGEIRRTSFSLTTNDPAMTFSLDNSSPETLDAFVNKAVLRDKAGRVVDNRAMLRVADAMTDAAIDAIRNWRYEAPANGPLTFDVRVYFKADGETSAVQNTGFVGTPRASTINTEGAVRVGGNIKAPVKVRDVRPVYPPIAQQAKVSGMVIVEARVGKDGSVEDARVLRSIPLLDQAALDAVLQWQFVPTLLNGVPTPVIMTVTVNFTIE
jgi:TonB family protein